MSQGEGGGRPRKFTDAKKLEKDIEAYFDSCFEERWVDEPLRHEDGSIDRDDNGKPILMPRKVKVQVVPFTVTGLALYLGVLKDTLLDYQNGINDDDNNKFSVPIKLAKQRIESSLETKLQEDTRHTGIIFALKNNFKWKDQVAIDHTTGGEQMKPQLSEHDQQQVDKALEMATKAYEEARKLNP